MRTSGRIERFAASASSQLVTVDYDVDPARSIKKLNSRFFKSWSDSSAFKIDICLERQPEDVDSLKLGAETRSRAFKYQLLFTSDGKMD